MFDENIVSLLALDRIWFIFFFSIGCPDVVINAHGEKTDSDRG